jgi:integrase
MSSVFKKARDRKRPAASWYIAYADENGVRRMVKGCPDKAATEAMARKLESEAELRRRGIIDPRTDAYATHEARPLADHLTDFQAALVAKGGAAKYALVTRNRAGKVLALARAERVSDLSLSKAQGALATLRADGLGPETVNHHVRAVKAFSRWLWRDGRVREHYLAHLSTSNPEVDRRRRRRALTPEEANRLVQAAERSPVVMGMTGPDRARCYALALGTGFRAGELASLTPERFDLDASPPTVTVQGGYTKNGKEAVQPLPPALAERLAPWLATLPSARAVFNLPDRTAEMIRVDLTAAGIEYEMPSGVVDFHALRGCYISYLVSSGASVKTCQTLARHSTPSLTIGIYAKASLHDITGAVGALPEPDPDHPRARGPGRDGDGWSNKNPTTGSAGEARRGRISAGPVGHWRR